jgi:hypothetical protein
MNKIKNVFLLQVRFTDGEGGEIFTSIHQYKKGAEKELARWCRDRWEELDLTNDVNKPISKGDKRAIKQYFDFMDPDEIYEISKMPLN